MLIAGGKSMKLTANAPEHRPNLPQKERILFQASIFRGEVLVSGRVSIWYYSQPILSWERAYLIP